MKRIFLVLAAAVAAAFAVELSAQPPEQENQDRPRGERRDGERRDGERGVRGERGERGRGGFGGPGGFRMPPNPVVAAIDADGNGELSEEEIKNASKALMALDKNGDKKLSGDEIRPQFGPGGPGGFQRGGFGNPGQFVDRLMENDANDDGKLSKDEVPERMQQGFDRLDSNSDGFIDRSELEEMSRRFQRGPGGRPGGAGGPGRDGDRPNGDNDSVSRDDL